MSRPKYTHSIAVPVAVASQIQDRVSGLETHLVDVFGTKFDSMNG